MQETVAFVDALVWNKPSPCSGKDGLVALVMAIAAGRSAEEKRWVSLAEMAGEICAMGDNDACELDVVDSLTGAIDFNKLLSPMMGIVEPLADQERSGEAHVVKALPAAQSVKRFGGGETTRDPEPMVYEQQPQPQQPRQPQQQQQQQPPQQQQASSPPSGPKRAPPRKRIGSTPRYRKGPSWEYVGDEDNGRASTADDIKVGRTGSAYR